MKKITSVLLALVLIVSCVMLASCKKETPETLVNDVMAKIESYDAFEANMNINMKMEVMGMTIEMPITSYVAAKNAKAEIPTMYMTMTMSMLGQEIESEYYFDGSEYAYVTIAGEGYKMNIADAMEAADTSTYNDVIVQYPTEVFENTEIVENEDGSKTVTLTIPDELFAELFDSMISSMYESLGASLGEASQNIKVTNASVVITTLDGDLIDYVITYDMSGTIEGMEMTTNVKASIEYLNFGEDVVVTPMEGYEDFTEIA